MEILETPQDKRSQGQPPKFGEVPNMRVSFVAPKPLIMLCQQYADMYCGGNRSDVILMALISLLESEQLPLGSPSPVGG